MASLKGDFLGDDNIVIISSIAVSCVLSGDDGGTTERYGNAVIRNERLRVTIV